MKGIPILMLVLMVVGLASAYSLQDCKAIESEINKIENSVSNYTELTMYSYYSRLGDKYYQLGECYQDVGLSGSPYYAMAGDNYEKAGDSYYAEPEKRYEYYVSAGDAYSLAKEENDALRAYRKAKAILDEHPEMSINPAYVSQRIYELQNPLSPVKKSEGGGMDLLPIIVGVVIVFVAFLGIYYLARRY